MSELLQPGQIIPQCGTTIDPRQLILDALNRAHHAGWFRNNWEGSIEATDRIVRALGLESKDGDQ